MIRLLAVEDERVIRTGLSRHVHWKTLGIDEVRLAANAEEAFTICQEYVPDIIISDIRMPGIDGIAMCRQLREWFPESEIIFTTGFSDKEYLKAAIDLHAVRYIEKPIQIPEVEDALQQAVRIVNENRNQRASVLNALFRDSSIRTFRSSGSKAYSIGILHLDQDIDLYVLREEITVRIKPLLEKFNMRILMESISDNLMGFLMGSRTEMPGKEQMKEITECICSCLHGEKWFLTFGSAIHDTDALALSWEEAYYAQKALAYLGWNNALYPGKMDQGKQDVHTLNLDDDLILEKWSAALISNRKEECQQLLDQVEHLLKDNKVFLDSDIKYGFSSMERSLRKAERLHEKNTLGMKTGSMDGNNTGRQSKSLERNTSVEQNYSPDEMNHPDQSASAGKKHTIRNLQDLETYDEILDNLRSRLDRIFETRSSGKVSYSIQTVVEYIHANYSNPSLSIQILADTVGLTPTYLSTLFKKHQGVTIGQYLANVRMEQAKILMKDPQLKFYEVAYQVGYEDINYFARIFKKANGCTLSEYRDRLIL